MAGTVNLRPEVGIEGAQMLKDLMDGVILERVGAAFQACRIMGEENPLVQGLTEKFNNFQNLYNGDLVTVVNKGSKSLEEYSDFATYVAKIQVDSSMKDVEVGTVKPNSYDAAKNL